METCPDRQTFLATVQHLRIVRVEVAQETPKETGEEKLFFAALSTRVKMYSGGAMESEWDRGTKRALSGCRGC